MSIKIKFETHSTTIDNEAGGSSGWFDVELSPLGLRQSKELGERNRDVRFDAIFCSDLRRSYETAEIAFAVRDIPIIKDKRLRECDYGDFTRKPSEKVEAQKPQRIAAPFPNGESYNDTTARMKDFLSDLRKDYDGKSVLIIGHRATQYGLDNLINGIPLEQLVSAKFRWQPGWDYELLSYADVAELVKKIAAESETMKNKIIGTHKAELCYTCIFAQTMPQYGQLESVISEIGRVVDNTPAGNVYELPPIETEAGVVRILKNRKPDLTRSEFGDCDFGLDDYTGFKRENLGEKGFSLIKRTDSEMIEYMEKGGAVRIYFSDPPVSY